MPFCRKKTLALEIDRDRMPFFGVIPGTIAKKKHIQPSDITSNA